MSDNENTMSLHNNSCEAFHDSDKWKVASTSPLKKKDGNNTRRLKSFANCENTLFIPPLNKDCWKIVLLHVLGIPEHHDRNVNSLLMTCTLFNGIIASFVGERLKFKCYFITKYSQHEMAYKENQRKANTIVKKKGVDREVLLS